MIWRHNCSFYYNQTIKFITAKTLLNNFKLIWGFKWKIIQILILENNIFKKLLSDTMICIKYREITVQFLSKNKCSIFLNCHRLGGSIQLKKTSSLLKYETCENSFSIDINCRKMDAKIQFMIKDCAKCCKKILWNLPIMWKNLLNCNFLELTSCSYNSAL